MDESPDLPVGDALRAIEAELEEARADGDRERLIALYRRGVWIARRDPLLAGVQAYMACALGDLYAGAGDYRAAAEAYAKLAPRPTPFPLLSRLGLVLLAFDPPQAEYVLSLALRSLPTDDASDLRIHLEAGLVWAMALSGNVYEAVRLSRDVLSRLAGSAGGGLARTLMRGTLGMVLFYHGEREEAHPHLESARAGWGARGMEEGVLLMNRVLIGVPLEEVTTAWLPLVLRPLLDADAGAASSYFNTMRSG